MTSANSSLVKKFIKEQRAITGRRLPLAALAIIMYALYDILGTALAIQRERASTYIWDVNYAVQTWPVRGAQIVSDLMGFRSIGFIIGIVGAILLAIQGFSWLYRSQTVDFYESRPEKRSTRFFNIVFNSIMIYTIPSLLGTLIAYLLAVLSGCGPVWLLAELMVTWLYQTALFLATYALSAVASLLTGTVITAVLMNAYFFGIEALLRLTIYFHRSAYYATFDSTDASIISTYYTLPLYHYLKGLINQNLFNATGSSYQWENAIRGMKASLPGALINLLIFAAAIAVAFLLYQKHCSEDAGKAVIYRPLAVFIKCSAALLFSLCAGLFIYWIFGRRSTVELPSVVVIIILSVLLGCMLLETIFGLNIRMALKSIWQVPLIAAAALLVLFVYRTDAFGYDRWLPQADQVDSSWLFNDGYYSSMYDDYGEYLDARTYAKNHMFYTGTEDMLQLAALGQQAQVENSRYFATDDVYDPPYQYGWSGVIGWRMKDGRMITRLIRIPEEVDPALMDRILGSEDYVRSANLLWDAEKMNRVVAMRNNGVSAPLQLTCMTEHGTKTGSSALLDGFLKAYEQDALDHYNFTMVTGNAPVGNVEIGIAGNSYTAYFGASYTIYEDYTRTIAFLEDNGVWPGGFLTAEEIASAEIDAGYFDDESGEWVDNKEVYEDTDQIREILNNSMSMSYDSPWMPYGRFEDTLHDYGYSLSVTPKNPNVDQEGVYYSRRFYAGKVPAFAAQIFAAIPESSAAQG